MAEALDGAAVEATRSHGDLGLMVTLAALAYIAPIPGEDVHSVEEEELYPPPGPAQCLEATGVLLALALLPEPNAYVQQSVNVVTVNDAGYGSPGSLWDANSEAPTVDGFKGQVMFQHSVVHAYMSSLGVELPLAPPEQTAAAGGPAPVSLVEPGFVHTFVPKTR
jgi:hypothetical protein